MSLDVAGVDLVAELDAWAARIAASTGLPATRDPGAVFPPMVYIGAPSATRVTTGTVMAVTVPVWLVGPAPGSKQNLDALLDVLPAFYMADLPTPPEVRAETLTIDGSDFPAYAATFVLHITADT